MNYAEKIKIYNKFEIGVGVDGNKKTKKSSK